MTLLPPRCLQAFSNPQLWATSLPVTIKSRQEEKCCLLFHPKWMDGRAGQFSNSYRNQWAFFQGGPQAKQRGSSLSQPPSNLTKRWLGTGWLPGPSWTQKVPQASQEPLVPAAQPGSPGAVVVRRARRRSSRDPTWGSRQHSDLSISIAISSKLVQLSFVSVTWHLG